MTVDDKKKKREREKSEKNTETLIENIISTVYILLMRIILN